MNESSSVIQVWKPEWNSYHFGIVADGMGCIHFEQDDPECFVEISIGDDEKWLRCPIEDYKFIKDVLGDSVTVRMRSCH